MDAKLKRPQPNNMASAACVMGLLSLVLTQTILIPLVLGSAAIIIAILSKGYNTKMTPQAKIGTVTSLIGIAIAVFLSTASIWMYMTDDAFRDETNKTFQEITGMTVEEYANQFSTELQNEE